MSHLDWTVIAKDAVKVGDVVSADAGGMPVYQVVAVEDGQAWVRDGLHADPLRLPLAHFHWRAAQR